MSNSKMTHITSIVALLFATMFVSGCGGADDTGLDEEIADIDESADTDEGIGEAESAMIRGSGSGGGDDFCGWFCPVWAKDLSDCLMIPCKD